MQSRARCRVPRNLSLYYRCRCAEDDFTSGYDRRAPLSPIWHATGNRHSKRQKLMPGHSEPVTSAPIRLVIAERYPIVLLGLEHFLNSLGDFAVVATASGGTESLG